MGEYPGMLPRKIISFHGLENESNEQKGCNTEGAENFPDLPRRSESDGECSDGGESPEKRLVELDVMPFCEIRKESIEGVGVTNMPNAVERVQDVSHDESQIIVSHLLGESLEGLDESGLRQLIENVPEPFETGLEEERSCAVDRGVSVGQMTESVTFLDDVMNLERGNWTSTPSNDAVYASGKRKSQGSEAEGECVLRPKIVAFEIGDGSDEESMAFRGEIGRVNVGKSCLSSDYTDRTLTEFGLSELEMMARTKAQELGPDSHVVSSDGIVRVPTMGSSGGFLDANAVRTKYYPSQSAKSLLKDFFEHNPPTHLDATHQTTSFSADQMIQFARAVGLEVSLASFGMLEDLLVKANLIGRLGGGGKASSKSTFSSYAGTSVGDSVASRSVYSLPTITESTRSDEVAMGSQEPCSSRQADEALFSVPIVCDKSGTDSLKTLKEIKTELVKKANNPFRWSRKGRPNPLPRSGEERGGYVFTEEMLALAPFAKVFPTLPEEPLKNRHCFFCMLCKKNISMKSRGLYELKRHYQRDCHLRIDQRFRERYCPWKVRGRDARVFYGVKLEKEREQYMELDVPDLCYKRPFYYDVIEGKPFTFTTESTRIRIQIELLLIFLKSGGQLWALDDYWTQVGVLTGHSAATADFNWSRSHISVSMMRFVVVVYVKKSLVAIGEESSVNEGQHNHNMT